MKKIIKWSVFLTVVLGIFWIAIPETWISSMSPLMNFGHNLKTETSISRFWDLLVVFPAFLFMYSMTKNDDDFNSGSMIITFISSFVVVLSFENSVRSIMIYIFGVFCLLAFIINISELDSDRTVSLSTKRFLACFFMVLLISSVLYGISNGTFIAVMFSAIYLSFWMVVIFIIYLCKFVINVPKTIVRWFKWMNE